MSDLLRQAVRERLLADARLGATSLPIGREVLIRLTQRAKPLSTTAPARPVLRPPAFPISTVSVGSRQSVSTASQPSVRPPPSSVSAPVPPPIPLPIQEPDQAKALDLLNQKCIIGCTRCPVLVKNRTQTVFGVGNPHAKLVFVGEAPGEDEDKQGIPFVGRAGQLLTKMIAAMGLDRDKDVYICNVLKCRPPNNRAPAPDEVANCSPFLWEQLRLLNPQVLVTLGNPATQTLLNTKVGITKLRGQWQELRVPGLEKPIKVMPTYHPSYLLRQGERDAGGKPPQAKREAWHDLQLVMAELGLKLTS